MHADKLPNRKAYQLILSPVYKGICSPTMSILGFVNLFKNIYSSNRVKSDLTFICITRILPEIKHIFTYLLTHWIFFFPFCFSFGIYSSLSFCSSSSHMTNIDFFFFVFSACHLSFNLICKRYSCLLCITKFLCGQAKEYCFYVLAFGSEL